jgi:hypothetical protein
VGFLLYEAPFARRMRASQPEETKMKPGTRKVPTKFAGDTHFELPVSTAAREQEFERLKSRLLEPLLAGTHDAGLREHLQRAAAEAASLAWMTPFPLLVLPILVEERAQEARRHAQLQAEVRARSQVLLENVA